MLSWIKEDKRNILLNYWKYRHFGYEWRIVNKRIERLYAMMESLIPEYKLSSFDYFDYVDTIPFDILHEYNKLDDLVDRYSSVADLVAFDQALAYDFFKDAVREYYTDIEFISIV